MFSILLIEEYFFISNSLNSSFPTKKDQMHSDASIESFFTGSVNKITGKAGFCFLGDTFSFHKGLSPSHSPRLLLQVIYSLKQTPFGPKKPFVPKREISFPLADSIFYLVNKNIMK